jgi:hypothetical protein
MTVVFGVWCLDGQTDSKQSCRFAPLATCQTVPAPYHLGSYRRGTAQIASLFARSSYRKLLRVVTNRGTRVTVLPVRDHCTAFKTAINTSSVPTQPYYSRGVADFDFRKTRKIEKCSSFDTCYSNSVYNPTSWQAYGSTSCTGHAYRM